MEVERPLEECKSCKYWLPNPDKGTKHPDYTCKLGFCQKAWLEKKKGGN